MALYKALTAINQLRPWTKRKRGPFCRELRLLHLQALLSESLFRTGSRWPQPEITHGLQSLFPPFENCFCVSKEKTFTASSTIFTRWLICLPGLYFPVSASLAPPTVFAAFFKCYLVHSLFSVLDPSLSQAKGNSVALPWGSPELFRSWLLLRFPGLGTSWTLASRTTDRTWAASGHSWDRPRITGCSHQPTDFLDVCMWGHQSHSPPSTDHCSRPPPQIVSVFQMENTFWWDITLTFFTATKNVLLTCGCQGEGESGRNGMGILD